MMAPVKSTEREPVSHHLMTIREASAEFGVSIGTLYAWVVLAKTPHGSTSGGLVLLSRSAVQRVVAEQTNDEGGRRSEATRAEERVG